MSEPAELPPEYVRDLRDLCARLDALRRSPAYGYYSMVPTSQIEDMAEMAQRLTSVLERTPG